MNETAVQRVDSLSVLWLHRRGSMYDDLKVFVNCESSQIFVRL